MSDYRSCPQCNEPVPDVFVPYNAVKSNRRFDDMPLGIVYCPSCSKATLITDIVEKHDPSTLVYGEVLVPKTTIKEACTKQREICESIGKHQKFGWYKYKKGAMIGAPEPE